MVVVRTLNSRITQSWIWDRGLPSPPFQSALHAAVKFLPPSAATLVISWPFEWPYNDVQLPPKLIKTPHQEFGLLFKCLPTLLTGVHFSAQISLCFCISLLLPEMELFVPILNFYSCHLFSSKGLTNASTLSHFLFLWDLLNNHLW